MSNNKCNCNMMLSLARHGDFNKLRKYMTGSDCLSCADANGNTVLHYLSGNVGKNMSGGNATVVDNVSNENAKVEIVDMLLNSPKGQELINRQNNMGETPILLAVKSGEELIANKLDESGANKNIPDIDGNVVEEDAKNQPNQENKEIVSDLSLDLHDGKMDTSLDLYKNTYDDVIATDNLIHAIKSKYDAFASKNNINNADKNVVLKFEEIVVNDVNKNNNLDTDNFIEDLKMKYGNKQEQHNNLKLEPIHENKNDGTNDSLDFDEIKKSAEKMENKVENHNIGSDNLNSDNIFHSESDNEITHLIEAVKKQENKENKDVVMHEQAGGKHHKSKVSGSRNLKMNSDYSSMNSTNTSRNTMPSELSRMAESRKDALNKQFLDRILKLLEKGQFIIESETVEPSERNKSIIKSYLYQYVRKKNPQARSFDIYELLKNMTDDQIVDIIESIKMKDLNDLEKIIEQSRQEKMEKRTDSESNLAMPNKNENSDSTLGLSSDKPVKKEKKVKTEKKEKDEKKEKSTKKKKSE